MISLMLSKMIPLVEVHYCGCITKILLSVLLQHVTRHFLKTSTLSWTRGDLKKTSSGETVDHQSPQSGVSNALAVSSSFTPVTCVLTNTDSFPIPINTFVETLNATDSSLILIREKHQIQTTSQINQQVEARGTRVTYRDNFLVPRQEFKNQTPKFELNSI